MLIKNFSTLKVPLAPKIFYPFKPLTPVPAITGRDELWPFFHSWRHHFWPKLASSIFNFCRRKSSFQWCPDQSDRPKRAWDMHKHAQNDEWKTQNKISFHYTWLLHCKNWPPWWYLLGSFLIASKPSRRSITAAERNENEKKERGKIPKIKKPKDVGRLSLLRTLEPKCHKTRF